jgi:anti-anti-sigma factor
MNLSILAVDGDSTHVRLKGPVTQNSVTAFGDVFRDHLGADIYGKAVLLDLSTVEWLDSSGVGWLLGCLKKFRQEDGRLILYSVPPRVAEIFRVLHLHTTFEIAANGKDAQQRVQGGAA